MAKSVEGKNKAAEKAAPKKAAEKKPAAPTMWGTSDVAKQLGVDPKFFRAVLRAAGKGSDGARYQWKIGDPLKAERKLIEEYQEKQAERKANAEEKEKSAKKKGPEKKAATKKKAKKAPVEEVEEEEEESDEVEEME